jgi:hypothetical protein
MKETQQNPSDWLEAPADSRGGREDVVQAQMERHLAVVVGVVPDHRGGQAEARVRAGIRALDGVKHVLCVDGAQRFADGGERIAQIDQQFLLGFRRAGAPLSQASGGF